ncbi:MAG: hypothetical protein JOZ29_02620 [Deltaproteobacteria bacterium]|nr:hypothetical protein [Deltaproteobacteria bacterium]
MDGITEKALTGAAGRSSAPRASSSPLAAGGRLEAHRDHYFRRTPARRVSSETMALRFINETGFCAAFTAGLGLPCLREAIEGRREPELPHHIQHDRAIMMTWNLKDVLPARRAVYYGKALGGRPGFIALDLLPCFLRLRLTSGGYQKLYQRGMLSYCAKLVMDTLTCRGPSETKALKLTAGFAQPKMRVEFDRAMKELQEKFLALKVEERYDPFTYVWDTVEHRWAEAMRAARSLRPQHAAYVIVRRYYEIAGYGNERAVARLLGLAPGMVETAARKLETERIVRRGIRVAEYRETLTLLAKFI